MNSSNDFCEFFLGEEREPFQIPIEQDKKDDDMDENNIFEPMEKELKRDENEDYRIYMEKIDELMNSLERIRAAL